MTQHRDDEATSSGMPPRAASDDPGADSTAAKPPATPTTPMSRRDFLRVGGLAGVATGLAATNLVAAGQAPASEVATSSAFAGPGPVPLSFRINGVARQATLEPRVTLLDALRDTLHLTGAKRVCDRGACGACTVILDGKAVYACSILAIDAQGRELRTIEGLGSPERLAPIQAAFVENDAQQCGFCTPGFVMACAAFLESHPHPTPEDVDRGLGGNLCRCGTYDGIRQAVLDASRSAPSGPAVLPARKSGRG